MSEDTPRSHTFSTRSKLTFWLQAVAYAFVVIAGVFWILTPSTIALTRLGPVVTPTTGVILLFGALLALVGHLRRHWFPEQIGAYLVAVCAGCYAYSIAIDSVSDATKGMGMCIVAAFFTLCILRIFQIERYTTPTVAGRRLAANQ
jgi:hypothetical protein